MPTLASKFCQQKNSAIQLCYGPPVLLKTTYKYTFFTPSRNAMVNYATFYF